MEVSRYACLHVCMAGLKYVCDREREKEWQREVFILFFRFISYLFSLVKIQLGKRVCKQQHNKSKLLVLGKHVVGLKQPQPTLLRFFFFTAGIPLNINSYSTNSVPEARSSPKQTAWWSETSNVLKSARCSQNQHNLSKSSTAERVALSHWGFHNW